MDDACSCDWQSFVHTRLNLPYLMWDVLTISQDLKDFARNSGQLDVVYSETGRDRDGKG